MPRATVETGTTVLSRMPVTTDSIRSAAWTVQSWPAGDCAMGGDYPRPSMRHALALVAGAALAGLGGLIVGEYPFHGWTPYLAGVLFGLVVAEVVVSVAGAQSVRLGVASAVFTAAGLAYAVWDDSGYGVRPISTAAWVGVAVGALVAGLRGGWWAAWRPPASQAERQEDLTTGLPDHHRDSGRMGGLEGERRGGWVMPPRRRLVGQLGGGRARRGRRHGEAIGSRRAGGGLRWCGRSRCGGALGRSGRR